VLIGNIIREDLHDAMTSLDLRNLRSQQHAMSTSRERPNPLRPYLHTSIHRVTTRSYRRNKLKNSWTWERMAVQHPTRRPRAICSQTSITLITYWTLSPSLVEMVKDLLDQALYKYTSVLLAQPFEIAKTILQVRSQAVGDGTILLAVRGGSARASFKSSGFNV
jgi:fusion and transport protein UGO1